MDSMRPPVFKPNTVPRSYTRLYSKTEKNANSVLENQKKQMTTGVRVLRLKSGSASRNKKQGRQR